MMFSAMREAKTRADDAHGLNDFVAIAHLIMGTKSFTEASQKAEAVHASERVRNVLKAATSAVTTSNSGLTNFGTALGSFMSALKNVGAFDAIAANAMQLPLLPGRIVIATAVAASTVNEGAPKPVRNLTLTSTDFSPIKVLSQIVMTREMVDGLTPEGLRILGIELKNSVALASDTAFLAALVGNEAEASGLDSFAGFVDDVEELLRLVDLRAASKPFLILSPSIAKAAAAQAMTAGITLPWNGGIIAGVEALVSDAQTFNRITLVDASSLAIAMGEIGLRSSEHASLEMSDAPAQNSTTPTHAQMVSMFQTGSRCLLAERSFAVKPIRQVGYAHLTNVALAESGNSPAGF